MFEMFAESLILHYDLSCSKVAVFLMDSHGQVKVDGQHQGRVRETTVGMYSLML